MLPRWALFLPMLGAGAVAIALALAGWSERGSDLVDFLSASWNSAPWLVLAAGFWLAVLAVTHLYLVLSPRWAKVSAEPVEVRPRHSPVRHSGDSEFLLHFVLAVISAVGTVTLALLSCSAAVGLTLVISLGVTGLGITGLWLVFGPTKTRHRFGVGMLILIGLLAVGAPLLFAVTFLLSPILVVLARFTRA